MEPNIAQLAAASNPATTNLSRVDDVMVAFGAIGTTVLVAIAYAQKSAGVWFNSPVSLLTLFSIAGFFLLLLIGLVVRYRERKTLRLWKLMIHSAETRVSTLVNNSRFTLTDISRAVETINSAGLANLVLDIPADRLYDGRLNAKINLAYECEGCGASTDCTVDIQNADSLHCQYCNTPFPTETINQLRMKQRQQVAFQNSASSLQAVRQQAELLARLPEPRLSLRVLLLLSIFFWPAAIVYVMRYLSSSHRFNRRLLAVAEN